MTTKTSELVRKALAQVHPSANHTNFNMTHESSYYQVQALSGRLTDMGVTEILPRKTYNIRVTIPFHS